MPTPYTNPWDETYPDGSIVPAANIDEAIKRVEIAIRERLVDILGIVWPNDTITEVTASKLVLKGVVSPKIIPGATSLVIRNNADSQDNLTISNSGAITIPSGDLTLSATATDRYVFISSAAGRTRAIRLLTAASPRWQITVNATAEGGANSGSDFSIDRYNDAGVYVSSPITITRSTGVVSIASGLVISAGGATLNGNSTLDGDFTITSPTGGRNLFISGAAGTAKNVRLRTLGLDRWIINSNTSAESGGNAGSNFNISRYDDAGVFISTPLSIFRSSGLVQIAEGLNIAAGGLTVVGTTNTQDISASSVGAGIDRTIFLSSDTGRTRALIIRTGVSNRWGLVVTNVAESGGNAGSNFEIYRYNDAGAYVSSPVVIDRNTGNVTFNHAVITNNTVIINSGGLTVSGNTDITGNISAIAAGVDRSITITGSSGFRKFIRIRTTATRWDIEGDNSVESGADAGTDLLIKAYTDAGALKSFNGQSYSIRIRRSDGNIFFAPNTTFLGYIDAASYINSTVGFRQGGAAIAGQFLRGDGTNFVSNNIQVWDLPIKLACRVYTSVDIIVASAVITTQTAVSWDSESYDAVAAHNPGLNPSRITLPVGDYSRSKMLVHTHLTVSGNANNRRIVQIRKNGNVVASSEGWSEADSVTGIQCTYIDNAPAAGDYYETFIGQDSGSNVTILATGSALTAAAANSLSVTEI